MYFNNWDTLLQFMIDGLNKKFYVSDFAPLNSLDNGTLSTLCGVGTSPSGSGVDYARILPLLPSDCQLTNLDLNNTTVLQNYQIT